MTANEQLNVGLGKVKVRVVHLLAAFTISYNLGEIGMPIPTCGVMTHFFYHLF